MRLEQMRELEISMVPDREVLLEFGPVRLSQQEEEDDFWVKRPVVDELGQWCGLEWEEKIHNLEELRRRWIEEQKSLNTVADYGFCQFGGWRDRKVAEEGYFRIRQGDGRWWFIDPDGHLFYSVGMDCVRYQSDTSVRNRQALFAALPPGHTEVANFYRWNLERRYGARWQKGWLETSLKRLQTWGFNTVANWSDQSVYEAGRMSYVTGVRLDVQFRNWQGFPDILDPEFQRLIQERARRTCSRYREDRMLIGYFIGNEPRWHQRNLVGRILDEGKETATGRFVQEYLARHGDTADSRAKLEEELARPYFQLVCEAIRAADPHHLILGIRWAGGAPDAMLRASRVFDVFSINIYRVQPDAAQLKHIAQMTGKPILIGEFHFGAPERGYAPGLVMVRDQRQRGVAYRNYVEQAAALPWVVGTHYFQYPGPAGNRALRWGELQHWFCQPAGRALLGACGSSFGNSPADLPGACW